MEIFESKEQYLDLIKAWKQTCKDKTFEFATEDYALYAILRDKDPKKCFASPEQQSKLKLRNQGKHGNESYNLAMNRIMKGYIDRDIIGSFSPFKDVLKQSHLDAMRAILKETDNA